MNTNFGAHLSIRGGFSEALKKADEIGASCLQIFSSSPRGWNFAQVNDKEIIQFNQIRENHSINPIYFHASYLINLADDGRIGNMSKQLLINELLIASQLNIKGSVIHLGSFKGEATEKSYKNLINNIKEILKETHPQTLFIIENAGNKKIGQSLEEVAHIITDVNSPRVRVCLDSCHLFSAGYRIGSENDVDSLINNFHLKIGLEKLELWHLNDSRDPFSSMRDRHENIGVGSIGIHTFIFLVNHPKINKLPFIIETPGFDGNGPDKKNIDILKSL